MQKLVLVFLFSFLGFLGYGQRTYIWCGSLITGTDNEARQNMTIVVEKNRIIAVEKGFTPVGSNNRVIDLKGKTVMPGWMDMHVHISSETSPTEYIERFQLNEADYAFKSVAFAKRTLLTGFTTIRDAGGTVVPALRNAINAGTVE